MAKKGNRAQAQDPSRVPRASAQSNSAQRLAAQRADAARDRIAAAQRQRRIRIAGSAIAAVVLIVAVLIVVKVTTGAGDPKSGTQATTAQAQVIREVSTVPAATFNAIGTGTAKTPPTKISGPALTSHGKPEVLYVGAEYCPYCAAERWAVAAALSRFGTLHGIGETTSSPSDVYPSTNTLSFHGATYTSPVLAFVPREIQSNQVVNGQYAPLDKLTSTQEKIVSTYDTSKYVASSGGGSIPFVDIDGRYLISGASYDPGVLQGKTHAQIAAALSDRTSPIARAVDGTATLITAALCDTTDNKPAAVCSSTSVGQAATQLK